MRIKITKKNVAIIGVFAVISGIAVATSMSAYRWRKRFYDFYAEPILKESELRTRAYADFLFSPVRPFKDEQWLGYMEFSIEMWLSFCLFYWEVGNKEWAEASSDIFALYLENPKREEEFFIKYHIDEPLRKVSDSLRKKGIDKLKAETERAKAFPIEDDWDATRKLYFRYENRQPILFSYTHSFIRWMNEILEQDWTLDPTDFFFYQNQQYVRWEDLSDETLSRVYEEDFPQKLTERDMTRRLYGQYLAKGISRKEENGKFYLYYLIAPGRFLECPMDADGFLCEPVTANTFSRLIVDRDGTWMFEEQPPACADHEKD